jgi:transposase-like protein
MPLDEEKDVARKQFSRAFKAKVALEALRGEKTRAQLCSQYGVHATQIDAWKKQALEALPEAFGRTAQRDRQAQEAEKDRLYQQIGKLQVEVEWLKKKSMELGLK